MNYFIGVEDLVANALIELVEKTENRTVSAYHTTQTVISVVSVWSQQVIIFVWMRQGKDKMNMTKVELTNVVEITYFTERDKNNVPKDLMMAMVHVPEDSLPPMSETDKKYGGRLLDVYFDKAVEILKNKIGPIELFPSHCFRFIGDMTMVY